MNFIYDYGASSLIYRKIDIAKYALSVYNDYGKSRDGVLIYYLNLIYICS